MVVYKEVRKVGGRSKSIMSIRDKERQKSIISRKLLKETNQTPKAENWRACYFSSVEIRKAAMSQNNPRISSKF